MFKSMEEKIRNSNFMYNFRAFAKDNLKFTDCLVNYSYLKAKEKKTGLTEGEKTMLYDSVHNCEDELFKAFNLNYKYASKYDKEAKFSLEKVVIKGMSKILRKSGIKESEVSPQYAADYIGASIAECLDEIFEKGKDTRIIKQDYYFGRIETSKGTVIKTLHFYHEGLISNVITEYDPEITSRHSFYDTLLSESLPEIMRRVSYTDIISELAKDIWFTQYENENWEYLKYFPVLRKTFFQYAETNFYYLLSNHSVFNMISDDISTYYEENSSDYDKADYSGKIDLYDDFCDVFEI